MFQGFYTNNMLSFNYKAPYLIVTIYGKNIKKEEWNVTKLVLEKFYNIQSQFNMECVQECCLWTSNIRRTK